ncbi:MAG: hypothetical protein QGG48_14195, partial [Desulfatiglandales bacterium]|nr:hypothetical protein [Desulfatiglandales bacterium]
IEQFGHNLCPKSIKNMMSGVPMASHGLIFGQNEGYRLQETFKTSPGPSWFHFRSQNDRKTFKNNINLDFRVKEVVFLVHRKPLRRRDSGAGLA